MNVRSTTPTTGAHARAQSTRAHDRAEATRAHDRAEVRVHVEAHLRREVLR